MRAQCCVCFNLLDSLHIAACPCGHTFHEECLIRWVDMSFSCPSCRTHVNKDQIIKRLFFDIHENCSEGDHIENMHVEIKSLKVRLIEKERQRQACSKARDRFSLMFSISEAARNLMLTKLKKEKIIKDAMQKEFTVILKENAAFIQEMKAFKETLRMQVPQEITTEMEDFQNDAQDTWNQFFEQGKPLLKQLASHMTVIKREYYQVKTVLQGLVTELKLSNSEVQKYKQELIVLKKDMEKTSESLKEMLPEKTILQKQVLELTHSHNEALKYKQEVEVLKKCLQKTSESLNPVKTVLQGLVTELKLSNSEVQKYKQEIIVLKKDMEKTSESLKEMLSEKTILQKQVLELTHSHNEALMYKQEVKVLRECLQTWTGVNPTSSC